MRQALEVFISYSDKDDELRKQLDEHLKLLEREGVISAWHSQKVLPGAERDQEIGIYIDQADMILLLISASFISSERHWNFEIAKALERHEAGNVIVIPIILRPVDWEFLFGKLQPLPENAKPVITWSPQDLAFEEITKGLRKYAEKIIEIRKETTYREKVQQYLEDGKLSFVELENLKDLAKKLELSESKSESIRNEERRSYEEYSDNIERYRQAYRYEIKSKFPLGNIARAHLRERQELLNVKDEDVRKIELQENQRLRRLHTQQGKLARAKPTPEIHKFHVNPKQIQDSSKAIVRAEPTDQQSSRKTEKSTDRKIFQPTDNKPHTDSRRKPKTSAKPTIVTSSSGVFLGKRRFLKLLGLGSAGLGIAFVYRFLSDGSHRLGNRREIYSESENVLIGHSSDVNSLTFTPDGTTLISASKDKTIRIWDIETRSITGALIGHTEEVYSVALSPLNSNLVISGSADKTIKIWDLVSKSSIRTLSGHRDFVNFVSSVPSGQLIASASYDGSVKVWDVSTGEVIYSLSHEDIALTAVFSPDGRYLATGGVDKKIRLWEIKTGNEVRVLTGHTDDVNWLIFSSDSQSIYSCSRDNTVRHWNVGTGKNVKTLTGHVGEVYTIALHPSETILASAGRDRIIRIWDLGNGKELQSFEAHSEWIYGIAFSPDGSLLASGSGEVVDNLKIWKTVEFMNRSEG